MCLGFDLLYALLYFLAMTNYWMEHDHKTDCWEQYGYGGHPRYQWFAVIAAFTSIFCVGGLILHSNQLCCLRLHELDMKYFRELYMFLCFQILWMGLSIVLELLVPQVKQTDLPVECTDNSMTTHEASKRVLTDFVLMLCWLTWLVSRTACAYTAFVLCSSHGEIERGVIWITSGKEYVKQCEDLIYAGNSSGRTQRIPDYNIQNPMVGHPTIVVDNHSGPNTTVTGNPVMQNGTGRAIQQFNLESMDQPTEIVGEPMPSTNNGIGTNGAITVYDGVQITK